MRWWRPTSLGDRITLLVLLTSAVAIGLVTVLLSAANHARFKEVAFESLRVQASIAALNSAAPMGFGDADTATQVLAGLGTLGDVHIATLYTPDGHAFARYVDPAAKLAQRRRPAGEDPRDGAYVVVLPVQERDDRLGTLEVVYDLATLRTDLLWNLLRSLGIGLLALSLSALTARKGARVLVRRLEQLDLTARRVAESRDYSVRADVSGGGVAASDEIAGFTRTFNEMLERIEQQDEALRASRQEALAASRLKDEFLATVSHELRTPMTPISGWAQMLARFAPENPRVVEAAQVIGRSATSMNRIIDDLLEMSRIISGKVRLDVTVFALDEVVADAVESVAIAAEAKDIKVSVDVQPGLRMRGDRHRIQQVLWNLLANSVKFTPAGGAVQVRARSEKRVLCVDVVDTGAGIDPAVLPYVFDRFRQADSSVTRPHGGLGLGLAIARQVVELHGGEISASSDGLGQGACFSFCLPLPADRRRDDPKTDPAADAAAAESPAVGSDPLAGLRVLYVEDDADARALVRELLGGHGAEVHVAQSAAQALEMMPLLTPDVLVSDIGMPGHDGFWLVRQVRGHAREAVSRVPAVALTAFAGEADRQHALEAGFDAYVAKPIDEAALVQCLAGLRRATAAD